MPRLPRFSGSDAAAYIGQRRERFPPLPGPGVDWSFTLPSGAGYQLLLGTATLTTSAAVANRFPTIALQNGDGLTFFRSIDSTAIPATTAASISFGPDVTTGAGNTGQLVTIGMPFINLDAGWRIAVITGGLDVADQWSGVRLYLSELHDTDPAEAPGHRAHPVIEIDLEAHANA